VVYEKHTETVFVASSTQLSQLLQNVLE